MKNIDDKIENLQSQLKSVAVQRDELSKKINDINILVVKYEGAIEFALQLKNEGKEQDNKNKKKEEKSD